MTHQTVQDQVWMMRDRELPAPERQALQAHVAACRDCAETARRAGVLQQLLATAPQPVASEAFVQAVLSRLPAPEPAARPIRVRPVISPWQVLERMGLGVAAATLTVAVLIRPQPAIATETLLRSDWPEQEGWAFSNESPEVNLLLGSTMEPE